MINDTINLKHPARLAAILAETAALGFNASCEEQTGVLLRALAASKPGGNILEVGTGTGVSSCWILDGADSSTRFTSLEIDSATHEVAKRNLSDYPNARFLEGDANQYLDSLSEEFDLVFADTFPGKFSNRENLLNHVRVGGFYVIDDLLPQANWPQDDHPLKVRALIDELESDDRFTILKLNWASGLMVCVKVSSSRTVYDRPSAAP